jgi:carboxylesterase
LIHNPDLDGAPFYWRGGPVGVLLIHGFTATVAEVRPLAEALLSAGYSVAGLLLPGHYTQPADLNQVHWQDWVTTVETAYQNLSSQCERVVVGGESTGGLLSLYLATQHPEIAALLLYAPALRLTLKPSSILRIYLFSPFVPWVSKDYMDDNPLWQGYPVNPLKGVIQLLKLQKQVRPLLSLVHQPTLIIQGRQDTSVHPEVPDAIYNGIQSSIREKIWMEKSGHCVLLEQERQAIFDLTLRFLERAVQKSPDLTLNSAKNI